ncbi:uncharacterized protein LOC142356996, partial [Convolutriloba macropyga]|uniref:uncharacterized protein LOC142356996 n=1 Tax=Convolutriloba macropyga TaxID=536237 RepID=UPI003F51ECE8
MASAKWTFFLLLLLLRRAFSTQQFDLGVFREECPCLKAYDVNPLFDLYALYLDVCFAYCMGKIDCVAFSYCDEGKECRGYTKDGIGYEPEAIENLDCQGYPSEPTTSHTRWFWVKEKTNGETYDCQSIRNEMFNEPIDSFDWEAIRVRGYPITVFCTWGLKYGETFGSPSNTYVDIHDDYHSTAKWGGSPSDEGPSAVLTRYWWYIQLIVDPCFLAINMSDTSLSSYQEGENTEATNTDQFRAKYL